MRLFATVRIAPLLLSAACALCASCDSETGGDPHSNSGIPAPGGKDQRIRDIADPRPKPDGKNHADIVSTTQPVSGAIVVAVDSYDETHNGKGTGTIYVQDLDATKDTPYAGISLFAPTFNPGNLSVSVGDVLDLRGTYTENTQIPSKPPIVFTTGAVLPQISQPVATFRYETGAAQPVELGNPASEPGAPQLNDLTTFEQGRRWLGMLVRVNDVVLQDDEYTSASGHSSFSVTAVTPNAPTACDAPFPKVVTIVNDLMSLDGLGLKKGSKIKTLVGVVGFFCSIKIAPRSPADIQGIQP